MLPNCLIIFESQIEFEIELKFNSLTLTFFHSPLIMKTKPIHHRRG